MNTMTRRLAVLLLAAAAILLTGCSSPEAKVESYSKRGHALLEKGDLVKARLEFMNALQINPSAVPALYGLGVVAARHRDWQAAYHSFSKVVELDPRHLQALVEVGRLQVASGQLDKALQTSDAALGVDGANPDVLALRAAILLKLNEPQQAVALANRSLAASPRHVDALVVLAMERIQAGDAERAVAFLDRGLEANERNVSLQMLKVQALENLAQPQRSEQVLRRLVALFPGNMEYRYLLAGFHANHRQFDQAEAEHRSIVKLAKNSTASVVELVRFLAATRGVQAAASELETVIRAQPDAHELKLALAPLRMQQRQEQAAIALWQQVIADAGGKPAGIRARGALAAHHLARREKDAARPLIEQMLAADGRDEEGLLLRAGIAIDERRLDDAVMDLRSILRDAPESPRAQLMLARAHDLQGLRELATQHYANAARMGRYAPQFAMPYAVNLVNTGRPRQVEPVLRELLRAHPGHLPALRLLAQSHLRAGDLVAAQAVADEAARSEAGAATASQIQGAVQAARRDFSGSIAAYRKAYELAPGDAQAMLSVVRSYVIANRQREALSFLDSVLAAAPGNAPARVLRGQLLAQGGRTDAGLQVLYEAIEREAEGPMAYHALVAVLIGTGKAGEALAVVDRGLRAHAGDFSLRLSRAGLLETLGKPEEAIAAYEQLVAERPNAVIAANNLAALLADHRKDPASVRRAYELAQRFRSSEIPHLKDTAGWTAHLAGKTREAADLLKGAAGGAPDLAVVHYHYGMNQLALNNTKAAREALQRSVELAKASPFAQVGEARKALQGL
ncbi:MAG TPA: tetratricopeptide repeat protein [Ramlibacter sp.]